MASQVELLSKPTFKRFLALTVVTGALKTAAIILSIGTMMKTAAA
jgi:hypothetical protein